MISDDRLLEYMVLARVPPWQFQGQKAIRDLCCDQGTAYEWEDGFILWFETDAAGANDLRNGKLPELVKSGPIFYGWAMLSGKNSRMLVRRLFKASGCKLLVFDRWPKARNLHSSSVSVVER